MQTAHRATRSTPARPAPASLPVLTNEQFQQVFGPILRRADFTAQGVAVVRAAYAALAAGTLPELLADSRSQGTTEQIMRVINGHFMAEFREAAAVCRKLNLGHGAYVYTRWLDQNVSPELAARAAQLVRHETPDRIQAQILDPNLLRRPPSIAA